jgi:hypothetical protein
MPSVFTLFIGVTTSLLFCFDQAAKTFRFRWARENAKFAPLSNQAIDIMRKYVFSWGGRSAAAPQNFLALATPSTLIYTARHHAGVADTPGGRLSRGS